MKKLIILALLTLSTQSFASYTISNLLAYTLAETIYTTAVPIASSEATTAATAGERRKEALLLKSDIQGYYQSGVMTLSLQNKVEIAKNIDSSLSLEESLDALTLAADILLE